MFFLGAAVGSFVNVMISRSISGRDWVKGRSICDHCKKPLSWFDMVPVFSYLLYMGKSRCCKRRLTIRHLLVESLFGLLFVWWLVIGTIFFRLVESPLIYLQPIFWLASGILLTTVLVSDLLYQLIPMRAVSVGISITILYRLILLAYGRYEMHDLLLSLLSAISAYGFLQLLRLATKGKGMGDGDPPLAFWLALILGWPRALVMIWTAFVAGGTLGVMLLVSKKAGPKTPLPFGPFLIAGLLASLLWGKALWELWLT